MEVPDSLFLHFVYIGLNEDVKLEFFMGYEAKSRPLLTFRT